MEGVYMGNQDRQKCQLKSGMVIGLGTGSSARFAVERIARLNKKGEFVDINRISGSAATCDLSRAVTGRPVLQPDLGGAGLLALRNITVKQ